MKRIHSSPTPRDRDPSPAEQAALGWVVRSERGLDAQQEEEFAAWLAAAPEHRVLFEEFGGTWAVMGRASEVAPLETAGQGAAGEVLPFTRATSQVAAGKARRGRRALWLSLAAAAALAIGVFSTQRPRVAATAATTEVGTSQQLTLADGSVVALNTDSRVVAAFAPDERRVKLEKGEAFFQVAKDAARPFVVEAAGVGVRAVGTAFNVRVHPTAIEVLVTEGVVRVAPTVGGLSDRAEFAEVRAGQRVSVPLHAEPMPTEVAATPMLLAVSAVAHDEMQRRLSWQGGRLEFSDTTLGDMVAEFNRYNRHKLLVPDAELTQMRFGGSFRPDDREGFVRMLRENFGVVAEERGEGTELHAAGR